MVRRFLIDGCCLFGLVCLRYLFVFENELLTRSIVSVGLLFTFFFVCFAFVLFLFLRYLSSPFFSLPGSGRQFEKLVAYPRKEIKSEHMVFEKRG